jgi:cytochrome c biogenesis protein CcmG/thiol:disulfide interchange protein DsbE
MILRALIPFAVFLLLIVLLWAGLKLDPRKIPSPLVDKPAPQFSLPRLDAPEKTLNSNDFLGQVWLLNIWASWCVACRSEHPVLNAWSRQDNLMLVGMDYKDKREDGLNWLKILGNPYNVSVMDEDGRAGMDWGVYGVPETFVIDKKGVIRYKHIGPISWDDLSTTLRPLIRRLEQESS